MEKKVKVSILLMTYNHEKFIKQALNSIFLQKSPYDYEIIVADDCSTDRTIEIVNEYKLYYPNKINILQNKSNLGITKNYQRGFRSCQGDYIAVLEGDDYWTSPKKIFKHVTFLENHRECVMSFNRFVVANEMEGRFNVQPWPVDDKFQIVTLTDLARDNFIGNFSTCVYRAEIIKNIEEKVYDLIAFDWLINMAVAQYGLIAYLPEIMSVYRLHPNGTWTQKSQIEKIQDIIKTIDIYNKFFNYRYNLEFTEQKNRLYVLLTKLTISNKVSLRKLIKDYVPPIIIKIIELLIPPKVLNNIKTNNFKKE